MAIQTVNPFTNEVIRSFDEMNDESVDMFIAQSVKTFNSWKQTSYKHRAVILHKVAALMRDKKEHLAKIISLEMGKLIVQTEGEILLSADIFDSYSTNAETFLADKHPKPKYGDAYVRCSRIGAIFGVEP